MLLQIIASLHLAATPVQPAVPIKPWIAAIPLISSADFKVHPYVVGTYATRSECQIAVSKFNDSLIKHNYIIKFDSGLMGAASSKHLARCLTDMEED